MLKLTPSQINEMLSSPETGMGYQVVEATMRDDKRKEGVVLNADLLVLKEERQQNLVQLRENYETAFRVAKDAGSEVRAIRVIGQPNQSMRLSEAVAKSLGGADGGPTAKTKSGDVFKRFSAYSNDRRVASDGSLTAGTFATTETDSKMVKTGIEAVARYAIPNPSPASYRYAIRPQKDTQITVGVAQPAYGQPGGGVEVIFTSGTQPKTVTLPPDHIPDV
jgi:hypothetical protein